MGRRRARLIAVSVVMSTALVTLASGQAFEVHPPMPSNAGAPANVPNRVIVAIRNIGTGAQFFTLENTNACGVTATRVDDGNAVSGIMLDAGDVMQVELYHPGSPTLQDLTCNWRINDMLPGTLDQTFTSTHRTTMLPAGPWDVQSQDTKLRSGETQTIYLTNNSLASAMYDTVAINHFNGFGVTFAGECEGTTSCTYSDMVPYASGSNKRLDLTCTNMTAQSITGSVVVYGASAPIGSATFSCEPGAAMMGMMTVNPPVVSINGMPGMQSTTQVGVSTTTLPSDQFTMATLNGDPDFVFMDPSCTQVGMQTCIPSSSVTVPPEHPLTIACMPTSSIRTAALTVYGAASMPETVMVQCDGGMSVGGITIVPDPVVIQGPPGSMASSLAQAMTSTTPPDDFGSAQISGDADFVFIDAKCASPGTQECLLTTPMAFPVELAIQCMPTTTLRSATLTVSGTQSASGFATVHCDGGGGTGPALMVDRSAIDVGMTPVGTTSPPELLTITNVGDTDTSITIDIPSSVWSVSGCDPNSACDLPAGNSVSVDVTFAPTVHGGADVPLTVTPAQGMAQQVSLMGIGIGGRLELVEPSAPYLINLGTVGKNTPRTATIRLRNTGNQNMTATLTEPPSPPFSLSRTTVPLAAGAPSAESVTVTCMSATAVPEMTIAIPITTSPPAYATVPPMLDDEVQVRCEVVDTEVSVGPELNFGEVWLASEPPALTVMITNPMTASRDAMVTGVTLVGADDKPLTLMPVAPQLLTRGQTLTTSLALSTSKEVDLAGASVMVSVDGVDLTLPIMGKVVTPAATITPSRLDLGTVCVGSDVTGQIALDNTGTATLTIKRPEMTGDFAPVFIEPTEYSSAGDASLAANSSALVGVQPSSSQVVATLSGTLTWDVEGLDAAPFNVMVDLAYVNTGAGVSPAALLFKSIPANDISNRQSVTIENCSDAEIVVGVKEVAATKGRESAWSVEPRTAQQRLLPKQRLTLSVAFAPTEPGEHLAKLVLLVGDEERDVELHAVALGEPVLDRTSFYACGCQGSTPPLRGFAMALLVALIVLRPRRS